jgi:hypothetical protein
VVFGIEKLVYRATFAGTIDDLMRKRVIYVLGLLFPMSLGWILRPWISLMMSVSVELMSVSVKQAFLKEFSGQFLVNEKDF